MKTVLKNGNVFYQNKIQKLDVEIDGETISQIGHDLEIGNYFIGENIIDFTDLLVTPGFVDLHVHLREPGFEHKGTIKTETLSAKYGGYTHIVAMANTNPCMDDKETIEDFIQRVQKDSSIHTYTYSAITKDLKGQELVDFKENNAFDIVQGFSDDGKGVQSKEMMAKAEKLGKNLYLPIDTTVADGFPNPIDAEIETMIVPTNAIPDDKEGLDIGPKTRELFADAVKNAKTVVWNGPMGVSENPCLAAGTIAVAKALADTDATTIIGGGDSAAAVNNLGFGDKMTHISTGGGASLEFLEGKDLPGVVAANDK